MTAKDNKNSSGIGPFTFYIIYLFAMIPTYEEGAAVEDIASMDYGVLILLAIFYLVMMIVTFYRSKKVNRPYLIAFPILGGVFDILLPFIILAPTAMHVAVIILGMMDPAKKTE